MTKVDDMSDDTVTRLALRFHNTPATHPCEHGHPEHALSPGGPCILDHVNRYVEMQCAGVGPLRESIKKYLRVGWICPDCGKYQHNRLRCTGCGHRNSNRGDLGADNGSR